MISVEQLLKISDLSTFIKNFTFYKSQQPRDELFEQGIGWNAALFIAKAIDLAESTESNSLAQLKKFTKDYNKRNKVKVDLESLFSKYWLRNVLDKIYIPGAISSVCNTFQKILKYQNELKFVCDFINKHPPEDKMIDEKLLESEFEAYNQQDGISLIEEGIYYSGWLSKDANNQVKIESLAYYEPFLSCWDEFEFINAYRAHQAAKKDQLVIDKKVLSELHQSFKLFYPKTPNIKILVNQKLITKSGKFYRLTFRNTTARYWHYLSNQIASSLWQLLLDKKANSDENRIIEFISKLGSKMSFDFNKYITKNARKRFLDAAFQLISNESDLVGIDTEFDKFSIDSWSGESFYWVFNSSQKKEEFKLDNSNHFELLNSLDQWESNQNGSFFIDQRSRDEIGFLLGTIIKSDFETDPYIDTHKNFPKIFQLLEESLNKPYLLYESTRYIKSFRKEFIVYLLADSSLSTLTFKLINQLDLLEEQKHELTTQLWVRSVDLLFDITYQSNYQPKETANLIFQIFRELNSGKYKIPYNRHAKSESLLRKQHLEKEQKVLTIIENRPLHKFHKSSEEYLIPVLFNELIALFISGAKSASQRNGVSQFPLLFWDGIQWLLKVSTYWKYAKQSEKIRFKTHFLANALLDQYLEKIEELEIVKYDYLEKKRHRGLPIWGEKNERVGFINWIYPVYFFHVIGRLGSFLSPKFSLEFSVDEYDKKNQFITKKIRTHLSVLLRILNNLLQLPMTYGLDENVMKDVRGRIEDQIIEYLRVHTVDEPDKGRVDLFNYLNDVAFKHSEEEALLPQLANSLNWFEKKEEIIDIIVRTQDLVKVLTIAEYVPSFGLRKLVVTKIEKASVKQFLESTHWIPEVQQVLLKISEYPQLIRHIEDIADFWETRVSLKNKEYESQLYQTRLLLAYFRKDEKELSAIVEPKTNLNYDKQLSSQDYKSFYRALIKFESDPNSAYLTFNGLVNRFSNYPVFAMNRMAAKINLGKEKNDNSLFAEALVEWEHYKEKGEEFDNKILGATFFSNQLFILLKLDRHKEIDKIYDKLDTSIAVNPEVIEMKVESLISRNKAEQATNLLDIAEEYHRYSFEDEIEFISELRSKVSGVNNVLELSSYYSKIYSSPPSRLIEVFPHDMNGQRELNRFLTNEIAIAADKMLDKIVSVGITKHEDEYNDLIEILMNARVNAWNWHVTGQSTGGHSDQKNRSKRKRTGERDLKIFAQKKVLGICEAFIYRSPGVAKSHLKKIFDYYHQHEVLIILIYDLDPRIKSGKNWNKYQNQVLKTTEFQKGFEFHEFVDLTSEFEFGQSAIKIGHSKHSNQIDLFHVFININYKT